MSKVYERKIGVRTIVGTEWPVHLIVIKKLNGRWAFAERCNGTCRWERGNFFTKREAEEAADSYDVSVSGEIEL